MRGAQANDYLVETWGRIASDVIEKAFKDGVVIEVRLEPKAPLAMGNYQPLIEARSAWKNSDTPT